jgi:hypothetical protein
MGVDIFILDYSLSYSIVDALSEHCQIQIKVETVDDKFFVAEAKSVQKEYDRRLQ